MTRSIPSPPTDLNGYPPLRDADGFTWDGEAAARAVDFFPKMLKHTEGPCAGKPFLLEKWQEDYIATLFGWKRADGTRRYRESMAAVPRKNGKSVLAAGIALYMLGSDGEQAGQVYSAAFSRDQASLVFAPASRMVKASPQLSKRFKIIESTKRIVYPMANSFYRAIPAEAANSHGFGASAVIFDELHTQTSRDLYDVLRSSQGARRQPLFVSITTAGHDRKSICWEVWNLARGVRDGLVRNPYFLPLIYELDGDDKWDDATTWHKCNPNLGVSISEDFLKEECQRAKDSPAYENTFRNLYLNEWTEQDIRWLPMDKWRLCGGELRSLLGSDCWAGLDLSTTTDITALVLAFPDADGKISLLCRFWVPAENARKREKRDQVPYRQWERDGFLTFTEGDVVDYDFVRRDLNTLREKYNIRELAIDRWNATQITTQLQGDGFTIEPFGQGYAAMSGPAKEFEKLVIGGQLAHGDNPVLTWMAGNVAAEMDAAGNIKPSKAKSHERIDGIVAAVMAVGQASKQGGQQFFYSSNEVEIG